MLIGFFLTILCVYNDRGIDIKQLFLIYQKRISRKPCHLISQGLRLSNIQLPTEEEQSTALPIGRRPMAVPIKRMTGENQDGSSSDIDKFLKDIFFYFNAGQTYYVLRKCIQYVGCYHFFCFLEESQLQGKGLHKKHMQTIKDGQHSKYQTRLLKAAGKRLHVLFKQFKYGTLAIVIPYSFAAFERWSREKFKKFISVIKQDKALSKELQDLQLRSTFLDKTGELHYIYYKDSDYIYCNDIQNNKEVHFCYLAFIQGRSVSLTLIVTK
ncbi:uncharacterized protein EV154DRAFT_488542 [Mucor mucedo]|uniref:uncharacterized protein n=1 Tax=Mucor mucedo TaxID=29922 RepID=UPI00221EFC2C|nr:uncharacterized protein EV154DRAFT_488542 [Mucor mucedo]KAI7866496.1 hypothetical protein EV154DRAFT_488542 [Mucor mucedo]